MIMITNLAHVCFTVSDLERSLRFYQDALGLSPAFDFINADGKRFGVYITLGGRNFIELFTGQPAQPTESQSFRHICLEVDDIQAMVYQLKSKGIEVSDPKLGMDHSWQAWITDPDGNKIELHDYTPESWQTPFLK
jgi:catechol 2,3-dioxygenase-like lactoylglutathione lyase family enzyme